MAQPPPTIWLGLTGSRGRGLVGSWIKGLPIVFKVHPETVDTQPIRPCRGISWVELDGWMFPRIWVFNICIKVAVFKSKIPHIGPHHRHTRDKAGLEGIYPPPPSIPKSLWFSHSLFSIKIIYFWILKKKIIHQHLNLYCSSSYSKIRCQKNLMWIIWRKLQCFPNEYLVEKLRIGRVATVCALSN